MPMARPVNASRPLRALEAKTAWWVWTPSLSVWDSCPKLLAASPFYDNDGLFPARVQRWADTMLEYPPASAVFEPGYTLGYRVNVQGEALVRVRLQRSHLGPGVRLGGRRALLLGVQQVAPADHERPGQPHQRDQPGQHG